MTTEAQKKAQKKYDQDNTVRVSLKLNKKTDADILERFLVVGSKQAYIKHLIRQDIAKRPKKERIDLTK